MRVFRASTLLLLFPLLFAGGPKDVTNQGEVFQWNAGVPVNFAIDQGPLGSLTNEQGATIVRSAVKKWEEVASSTIDFADQSPLPMDVTGANYKSFLGDQVHPENPMVFDSDATIIEDRLGKGSAESVLGFHQVRFVDSSTTRYVSGWIVLNGALAEDRTFEQVVIHELGHLIGLDHTQAGHAAGKDRFDGNNLFVPIMYPFVLGGGPQKPLRDDIAWISWLYPESNFRSTTGTIKGKVFRRTGGNFPGAHVVAVQVDANLAESNEEVVSAVSDFLMRNDGSYELPGLSPGNYVVFIEPLDPRFTKGSGVGPFDTRFTNFVKDYYNGSQETGTDSDDPTEKVVISVSAGQTVEGITLLANEKINDLDALTDDDEMLYEFPSGFTFPFFGKTYTEIVVNSDGNLTFGGGDSRPGAARSEERFLTGAPRIAPLFTDLDPGSRSDGKDVKATASATEITFTWENVPEFTEGSERPGNQFSVTLFSNGDIRFKYEKVEVTPDPDNLQAIAGITPGGSAPGASVDLSAQPAPISIGNAPIYEVFAGTTFDLTGKEILFKAGSSSVQTTHFYFPFYQGNAQNFTGYAITNFSSGEAQLRIEGLGSDGKPLPFSGNPHSEKIASQKQTARLGSEFFNVNLSTVQSGWIRIASDRSELASFFQFGNGLAGPLTKMDGSVALKEQSRVLYFTRLHSGAAAFRGLRDAQTLLSIANPNSEPVTLTFRAFKPTGEQIGNPVQKALAPLGMLFQSVASLFNVATPLTDGFVKVDVEGPGAVGFELVELSDTLLGLNAATGNSGNTSYSAQLANGTAGGVSVFTNIKLVNTASVPRAVTLTAYREDGSIIGVVPPSALVLNPNRTFQKDVNEIFSLGPSTGLAVAGSMVAEADGPGVIGDVVFGDPLTLDFAAAIPLQTTLFTKAIFSQVANGSLDPANPSMNAFTGIALFNPNAESASVTVRVLDRDGNLVGARQLSLGKTQRVSDTVQNLVPASAGLLRGYIVMESTRPLVAQQLFGNVTLKFLSAVPPTVVQ